MKKDKRTITPEALHSLSNELHNRLHSTMDEFFKENVHRFGNCEDMYLTAGAGIGMTLTRMCYAFRPDAPIEGILEFNNRISTAMDTMALEKLAESLGIKI